MGIRASADWLNCLNKIDKKDSKIDFEMNECYRCRGNTWTMCEFHDSNCNGFGLNERMYEKIKVNLTETS